MSPEDASPVGTGRVRGPGTQGRSLGWLQAGFIVYAFAAPSAVMAFPFAIGMAGFVGGTFICLIITGASIGGSLMLLEVKLANRNCHTFGQLGKTVMGRAGEIWGNLIQLGNFCLFLPCALTFCALALEGVGKGIPGITCNDYYVFLVAGVCFITTQVRTFKNTQLMSLVSIVSVFAMALIMIVASFQYSNPNKIPANYFGNPEPDQTINLVKAAGGFTITAWAYVPAFLTVELSTCMQSPEQFRYSLYLSGFLNVAVFMVVGLTVVNRWGYDVGEVIGITAVDAWKPGAITNTTFNAFQLAGNFVSYMLDSVPLGRFCQKSWAPTFLDTWSSRDILWYAAYTLPTFLFGLSLAVFVPSVNTLLDFTTAFTTPMVTQIYPAVLYWKMHQSAPSAPILGEPMVKLQAKQKLGVAAVFCVGVVNLVVCFVKAIGYLAIAELRPPMAIGCPGWQIYSGSSQLASQLVAAVSELVV